MRITKYKVTGEDNWLVTLMSTLVITPRKWRIWKRSISWYNELLVVLIPFTNIIMTETRMQSDKYPRLYSYTPRSK